MKYLSLFSGIGGFEYAIKDKAECIGYSEIDKWAEAIYQYHYPEHRNYGDATRIIPEKLPDFNLLVAGFPCQDFSIAGKRAGLEGIRGTLFFEIARIAAVKRPKLLLLENVKGLLSSDKGQTFATILSTLSDLGYVCEWQIFNSKDYGVPQNRERVFIIGHLGKICGQAVFPIGQTDEFNNNKNQELPMQISNTLRTNYSSAFSNETYVGKVVPPTKQYLLHNVYGGFGEKKPREFTDYSPAIRTPKGGGHLPMLMMRDGRDNRSCLRSGRTSEIGTEGMSIRRLTPIECERLQAFPDNWTKWGMIDNKKVEISDTQRYKCLGNAVTTTVVAVIMRIMLEDTRLNLLQPLQ